MSITPLILTLRANIFRDPLKKKLFINQNISNVLCLSFGSTVTDGEKGLYSELMSNKRASLACAARLADTVSAGGALWAPVVTLINYMGDNIPKYVCPTVIFDIARKITKFVNF